MTDGSSPRPIGVDFFHPARLFGRLRERPSFLVPLLLLAACSLLYVEVAARCALPQVVPALLDRAVVTESELRSTFQRALRVVGFVGPLILLPATALVAGLMLRLARARVSDRAVLAIFSWAGVWIALGFLAKAALVPVLGRADPAMNVGAFVRPADSLARALCALTNPFAWLAIAWTVRGLRAFEVPKWRSAIVGSAPWIAWLVGLAVLFVGGDRFGLEEPVPAKDWKAITRGPITLRHPPALARDAEHMIVALDTFAERLGKELGFEPTPLRVYLYPDHAALERAAGERLHVMAIGSVRGADLVYLERPRANPAVPPERALREALRYVGLVELASSAEGAPRWFVEGFVHAAVYPGDARLAREFRAALQHSGVPRYDQLQEPTYFRTVEGPLFARSLVDHIAFLQGRDAPQKIMHDVIAGTPFRDALFTHTHLTTSALEAGWVEALKSASGGTQPAAPADSGTPRLDEVEPFRRGK